MQKRTRAIPEKVEQLLNLINALPSEPRRFFYAVERYRLEEIVADFIATVAKLPKHLRKFIGQIDPKTAATLLLIEPRGSRGYKAGQTMRAAYNRYIMIVSARDALLQIAAYNDCKYEHEYPDKVKFTRSIPVEVTIVVKLQASNKGHFFLTDNPGFEALIDERMEVERIRQCPICGNIYWAGRITKPACSVACDNALRQRRFREKTEDETSMYKQARIKAKETRESTNQPKPSHSRKATGR